MSWASPGEHVAVGGARHVDLVVAWGEGTWVKVVVVVVAAAVVVVQVVVVLLLLLLATLMQRWVCVCCAPPVGLFGVKSLAS
jgi:hypothetical protein